MGGLVIFLFSLIVFGGIVIDSQQHANMEHGGKFDLI